MGTTDNGQAKQQTIVLGPLAAFVPMKMMGTNGGGFFGMNSAHPFENPSAGTNFFETFCMMLFPMALVLMYGRMLKRLRHAMVIFSVMLLLFTGTVVWAIYFDTMKPNPGLTAHPLSPNIHDCECECAGRETALLHCRPWRDCRSISIWAISKAKNCVSAPRRQRPSQPRRLM